MTVLTFLTWKESKYVISKQTELFTAKEVISKLFCCEVIEKDFGLSWTSALGEAFIA